MSPWIKSKKLINQNDSSFPCIQQNESFSKQTMKFKTPEQVSSKGVFLDQRPPSFGINNRHSGKQCYTIEIGIDK